MQRRAMYRGKDCIVISDKISKLNIYGRVWHPINSNSGEVKSGTWPVKGINNAKHWVNGYNVSGAPAKSVTHVSF
jgi:hypothetical protein